MLTCDDVADQARNDWHSEECSIQMRHCIFSSTGYVAVLTYSYVHARALPCQLLSRNYLRYLGSLQEVAARSLHRRYALPFTSHCPIVGCTLLLFLQVPSCLRSTNRCNMFFPPLNLWRFGENHCMQLQSGLLKPVLGQSVDLLVYQWVIPLLLAEVALENDRWGPSAAAFRMDGQTHIATSTLMSYEHAELPE